MQKRRQQTAETYGKQLVVALLGGLILAAVVTSVLLLVLSVLNVLGTASDAVLARGCVAVLFAAAFLGGLFAVNVMRGRPLLWGCASGTADGAALLLIGWCMGVQAQVPALLLRVGVMLLGGALAGAVRAARKK